MGALGEPSLDFAPGVRRRVLGGSLSQTERSLQRRCDVGSCSSAQTRATRLYDHLDFLLEQRKRAEADLLREAKEAAHRADPGDRTRPRTDPPSTAGPDCRDAPPLPHEATVLELLWAGHRDPLELLVEPRLPVNPDVMPGPPAGQAEPFRYRLGLDLGSNSIGWCVLDLDAEGRPCGVRDAGVRILSPNDEAGRDPQSKTSS